MTSKDNYESVVSEDWLRVLLDSGSELGFDPTSSDEMERWCHNLILRSRPLDEDTLAKMLVSAFKCVEGRPRWIQNPDWQLGKEGPMLFVEQIDCLPSVSLFHDQSSFYVFYDPETGDRRVVIQVA